MALIAALLLVVGPLLVVAAKIGAFRSPTIRAAAVAFVAAVCFMQFPEEGFYEDMLDRFKMMLAGAVAIALMLRAGATGASWPRTSWKIFLAFTAVASIVLYTNFFRFHGTYGSVHWHEVTHYYLSGKYFPELGYGRLYTAIIRAESEMNAAAPQGRTARDLSTNRIVDATELLAGSQTVRDRFSDARWADFQRDVSFLKTMLGSRWQNVCIDHGYNPTPVWALIGGRLANKVEAGDGPAIFRLTFIDPILLGVSAIAIAGAFGAEVALLAISLYGVVFGASYAWVGGAYLRSLWLCLTILAFCCLRREMPAAAGGLFAFASLVQVFPIFFAVPIGLQAVGTFWRTRRISPATVQFIAGFAVAATTLFVATCWVAPGLAGWREFTANSRIYMLNMAPNIVGLTSLATALLGRSFATSTDVSAELFDIRLQVQRTQLLVLLPLVMVGVGVLAQRRRPHEVAGLGVMLILAALSPGAYYFTFLVVVLLANSEHLDRVAWLFVMEFLTYVLELFEPNRNVIYLYRSALVFWLSVVLAVDMARDRTEHVADFSKGVAARPHTA